MYSNFAVLLEVRSALPGDYNGDGAVNAADYVAWHQNDGMQEGYDTWRTNFGRTSGNGLDDTNVLPNSAAVPEPSMSILVCLVLAIRSQIGHYRRHKRFS